jgi:hypothetical protein
MRAGTMRIRGASVALLVLLAATGCTTHRRWAYTPNGRAPDGAPRRERLVVLPFHDDRPTENENYLPMFMFPAFPFGWADYATPETTGQHITSLRWLDYKPADDFARALVDELRAGFDVAPLGAERGRADLTIEGSIHSTRYTGKIFTYGASYFGFALWMVGLPMGTFSNELEVELVCFDARKQQTVFAKRYTAPRYSATTWIYPMKDDFNYPTMLAGIYREFAQDLAGQLAARAAAAS